MRQYERHPPDIPQLPPNMKIYKMNVILSLYFREIYIFYSNKFNWIV